MSRKKKGEPVHGWLILDKPEGVTSTQAVGACRRIYNAQKCGHGGTLDPLASGILPMAFGEATKTVGYVMEADKDYAFTIRWGSSTTTQDREGEVTGTSDVRPSRAAIETALATFVGEIEQVPPQYSAIKVNGERAYDLARDGETVELASRKVNLYAATLADMPSEDLAVFKVTCGKGFYIRALVRDIAAALGAEGHVAALRRTRVGAFAEDAAIQLSILQQMSDKPALDDHLVPLETALDAARAGLALLRDRLFPLEDGNTADNTPYRPQQALPNFDSGAADFNFASIYLENAFVGHDKISDNNLLTLGLTTRYLDAQDGSQIARFLVAQRLRFEDQLVTINSATAPALAGLPGKSLLGSNLGATSDFKFSGDGRFVLSGSEDTNLRIWKAQANAKLGVVDGREAIVGLLFPADFVGRLFGVLAERVRKPSVRIAAQIAGGDARQLLDVGAHRGAAERAVDANAEGLRVADAVVKRGDGLTRERAAGGAHAVSPQIEAAAIETVHGGTVIEDVAARQNRDEFACAGLQP